MKLAGRWAWWNENSDRSFNLDLCVRRAKDARLVGAIIKWGYPKTEQAFTAAGIPWAVERYVKYSQPEVEGQRLANAVGVGAVAAIINAEEGGDEQTGGHWERDTDGQAMRTLIATFRQRCPDIELYASVDTRGDRLNDPYQRVLAQHIAGWLPMVYPLAFRPNRPSGFVTRAFADCLDGKDFGGIPVLPTIQTYDGIGKQAVVDELAEVKRRGLPGCQAYTIPHATDEEWAEFAKEALVIPTPTSTWDEDKKALDIYKMLWDLNKVLAAGDLQLLANKLARVGVRATV